MKRNIIILLLILIAALIIFILSDKRIVIENNQYAEGEGVSEGVSSAEEQPTEQQTNALQTSSNASGIVIAIDPGHQSKGDPGTEPIAPGSDEQKARVSSGTRGTASNTPEYAVNLQVSLLLRDELTSRGYTVIMTRETNDVSISNSERAAVANNANADAFVRIHCNGSNDSSVAGALTMCQTSSNPYCGDLYAQSRSLSESILDCLCAATGAKNRGITETDTMSGINWSRVPVTIVEMGFMTNPQEDRLLNDNDYQHKLAVGIANGIDKHFNVQ